MEIIMSKKPKQVIAAYVRLSREDGDKTESDSITNQIIKIKGFIKSLPEFSDYDMEIYADDGFTGTNFERPGYKQMITDIENEKISIVIAKDLSRLGRHMPKVTELVQEYFPGKKVRFIAIDDNIDKKYYDFDSSEDMMIDMKNMFNGFYPKDISKKVRSTFRAKQASGQFIGAFACYGYKKDAADHNHLVKDEAASKVVERIFRLYLSGKGQNTIAKMLNEEQIPCPSEYKRLCGLNYHNCKKLGSTTYWTYASIRNILRNRIYTGCMVQNTHFRQVCKKKAIKLPEDQWIIVEDTHEAIIEKDTFEKAQMLLARNTRQTGLGQNIHIFAGLIKCGDCGRAMVKIKRGNDTTFCCGSYNRYGTAHCSPHNIHISAIEETVIRDLNAILSSIGNVRDIVEEERKKQEKANTDCSAEISRLENELQKLEKKKSRAYDDYSEDLITKEDFVRYKKKYDSCSDNIKKQLNILESGTEQKKPVHSEWADRLLEIGYIEKLDRETVIDMIHMIYIFADNRIQIIYNFSDELEDILCKA